MALHLLRAGVEDQRDDGERRGARGQVHVEDPPPGEAVDEPPAEERADHGRDAEDGTEEAHVPAALARADDVADDGHRRHHEPAPAEPLEAAERDQLGHVLAEPAQHRADEEEHDRRLEHDLAAVEVAELAVERPGDRRGEQVAGHDPGEVLYPAQVADDRGQRRGDDRLVQRRQQHHEQQRAEDQAHPRRGGNGRGYGVRGGHGQCAPQAARA